MLRCGRAFYSQNKSKKYMIVYVHHNLLDVLSHCHWATTP